MEPPGTNVEDPVAVGTFSLGNNGTVVISYNYTGKSRPEFLVDPANTVLESKGFDTSLRGDLIANNTSDVHWVRLNPSIKLNSGQKSSGSNWALFRGISHSNEIALRTPSGYIGREFIAIGNVETYYKTVGCERFTLVVPAGADLRSQPETILDTLAKGARSVHIGHRYEEVRIFVTPTTLESRNGDQLGGYTPRRSNEAIVQDSRRATTAWNAWLHEYVHIRQTRTAHPSMLWYSEASASYFSARAALESGIASPRQYDKILAQAARLNGSALPAPNSAPKSQVAYFYGVVVLDTLDYILVSETKTNLTVIARDINTARNPKYSDFTRRLLVSGVSNRTVSNTTAVIHRGRSPSPKYIMGPDQLPALVRIAFGVVDCPRLWQMLGGICVLSAIVGISYNYWTNEKTQTEADS